ncbi:hypothetical protein F2Q68_00043178 [Brassica cretica]|uniref:Uncharacterized protein n=1 Tax=Brassica cretica TaxID=69181 RepID=A0A8S9LTT8_BRACR|nr:hypothetical protein F2Q68_00043178 [Brassica cretica]
MTILSLLTIFRLLLRLLCLPRGDLVLAAVEILSFVITVGSACRSQFVPLVVTVGSAFRVFRVGSRIRQVEAAGALQWSRGLVPYLLRKRASEKDMKDSFIISTSLAVYSPDFSGSQALSSCIPSALGTRRLILSSYWGRMVWTAREFHSADYEEIRSETLSSWRFSGTGPIGQSCFVVDSLLSCHTFIL